MKVLAYVMGAMMYVVFIVVVLFLFGLILPLFVAGYVVYKIPFIIREHLKFRQALKEVSDGN